MPGGDYTARRRKEKAVVRTAQQKRAGTYVEPPKKPVNYDTGNTGSKNMNKNIMWANIRKAKEKGTYVEPSKIRESTTNFRTGKIMYRDEHEAWQKTRKGNADNKGGSWEHNVRMFEDPAYYAKVKAGKKANDKAGFGGRLKKLGGAATGLVSDLGKAAVDFATNPGGAVILAGMTAGLSGALTGAPAGGAAAGGAAAGGAAAGGAGGVTGLGASLHGVGAAVAPLGTAGAGAGAAAAAGTAAASGLGASLHGTGAAISPLGTAGGSIAGGVKAVSGLSDWIKPGLAIADAAGSILGGIAGAEDSKDAREAANPFAKYRDYYAGKLQSLYENPDSLRDTPGYKFRFDEGMRALNRTSAAKGDRLSGNVLLEASRYGQGLADQMRGEEIDRLGGLSGATMGFSNAGYDSRSKTAAGISEALGTAGDYYGRTNYWSDDKGKA